MTLKILWLVHNFYFIMNFWKSFSSSGEAWLQVNFILYVVSFCMWPPVCMKYTARGESPVANIARSEAECYTYLSRDPHQKLYLSYKQSVNALSVLYLLMCE